MSRCARRFLVATVACAGLVLVACGHHGDGLIQGKVDIGLTTTTGTTACDVVVVAERAISEATFAAIGADATERASTEQRFAELRTSLPSALATEVDALEVAFRAAWRGRDPEADDPFETTAYVRADQAIRHFVDACSGPGSTGDPSRAPTTAALPPEAMTIPLPPGEPPPG